MKLLNLLSVLLTVISYFFLYVTVFRFNTNVRMVLDYCLDQCIYSVLVIVV